jgi:NMD protein affecting ribosome stability and mRNA decay
MGFCPRCGKTTEQQFCNDCLRELHPLITKIKNVSVTMCPICLRTLNKAAWSKRDVQKFVEHNLEKAISFAPGARIDEVLLEPVALEPGKQELQLTIAGSADPEGATYEEYYSVPILIQGNRCKECERAANTYFTGILQLRRPNDIVQHEIERLLGSFATSVKDVTGGIDYYVSDHRVLQNVARQVHSQFGGELTVRAQHFSYDSLASKNLYRVNACLRLPPYWKGSLVQAGTKLVLISNMGKLLKGVDIMTGKVVSAPCNNEYQVFPLVETSIVTVRPTITVLDPETFQTIPVQNQREEWKTLQPGALVHVSNVDDQLYLVHPL